MAQCLENHKNTATNLMFPRCHYIRNEADYDAFLQDYIITALVGTLKIIAQAIEENKRIFSENGSVSYNSMSVNYGRNNKNYWLTSYPTK